MAKMKFANNANTTLASSLTAIATSMSVVSSSLFPTLNPVAPIPEYFYCTLTDVATNTRIEIVKVTAISGTTWTITRGQDGTTGAIFAAGDVVSLRLVKASLDNFPKLDEVNTFTSVQTFSSQPILSSLTASSAVATDASKGLVSVTNTGSGNNVLATSPTITGATLTTAALNGTLGATTPSTVVATTITGTDLTTTGNTILGNASTDTLNVGNGDLIKDASGNVGIGVTPAGTGGCLQLKSGITFPATQSASADANTLDDYQEYTAPSAACTGAITTAVIWKATKVGNVVTLTLPTTTGTASAATNFQYGELLPADFRPSANIGFLSCQIKDADANSAIPGLILILTTGAIKVYKDGTAATNFTAGLTAGIGQTLATAVSWTI